MMSMPVTAGCGRGVSIQLFSLIMIGTGWCICGDWQGLEKVICKRYCTLYPVWGWYQVMMVVGCHTWKDEDRCQKSIEEDLVVLPYIYLYCELILTFVEHAPSLWFLDPCAQRIKGLIRVHYVQKALIIITFYQTWSGK
jgi:hypothetical protein